MRKIQKWLFFTISHFIVPSYNFQNMSDQPTAQMTHWLRNLKFQYEYFSLHEVGGQPSFQIIIL